MPLKKNWLGCLPALLFFLSACAAAPAGPDTPAETPVPATSPPAATRTETATSIAAETAASTTPGSALNGTNELIHALRSAGGTVEPVGSILQPFLNVTGQALQVNGAEVQVYEYADVPGRTADSDRIAPDGSAIGTSMPDWIDTPNFWASGRLIVLYVGQDPAILQLLSENLGPPLTPHSAVPGGTLQPPGLPGQGTAEPPAGSGPLPEAVQAAVKDLSRTLNLPAEEIAVLSQEAAQWPDSCLGLATPDEMCLQVITPGWRVILEAGGRQFEYHTDESGKRMRLKPALAP